MSKARILSITYNESLMQTREMILRNAGYDVTSALGFVEAQSVCAEQPFDLVIVGHSIPTNDKLAIIKCAKARTGAVVLCLRKPNAPVLREADYSTDETDPGGLVAAVKSALANGRRSGQ